MGATILGGEGRASVVGLHLDPAGGLFVFGDFSGAVDFDPGSEQDLRTARTESDLYVLRLPRFLSEQP